MPSSENMLNLQSCVYMHTHERYLWIVCRCKKLTSARKQMSVFEAPNVLVIQLKVNAQKIDLPLGLFLYIMLHNCFNNVYLIL